MICAKRAWRFGFTLLSTAVLMSAFDFSQENTGTISGFVHDPSGASVKDATVSVTNTDRNQVVATTKTNDNRFYTITKLPIGRYTVSAEITGFKKSNLQQLSVNANDKLTANFML